MSVGFFLGNKRGFIYISFILNFWLIELTAYNQPRPILACPERLKDLRLRISVGRVTTIARCAAQSRQHSNFIASETYHSAVNRVSLLIPYSLPSAHAQVSRRGH